MYFNIIAHFNISISFILLLGVKTISLFGMLGVGIIPAILVLPPTIYASMKFSEFIASFIMDVFDESLHDISMFKCPECDEIGHHKKHLEGDKIYMNTNCSASNGVLKSKL